jgi:UDP-N-acetylglucosamine enolpyruvyl transferase
MGAGIEGLDGDMVTASDGATLAGAVHVVMPDHSEIGTIA